MDTQKKYGIRKRNAVMLFVQMIFVILGAMNAALSVYDGVVSGLGVLPVIAAIVDLLAFIAIIHYSIMGFRRQDDLAFIGVIYAFTAALLVKQVLLYNGVAVKIIVGVAFGLAFLFTQCLKDRKKAVRTMNVVSLLLLAAGIILTIQLIAGKGHDTVVPEAEVIQLTPEQVKNMTPDQLTELQAMVAGDSSEMVTEDDKTRTTMRLVNDSEPEAQDWESLFVSNIDAKNLPLFRKLVMFCSFWSPLLLAITILLTYQTRIKRAAAKKPADHHKRR